MSLKGQDFFSAPTRLADGRRPDHRYREAIWRLLSRDGTNPFQACQSPAMPQKQSGS